MTNDKRKTDGLTVNKFMTVVAGTAVTVCMSLITWVYTSDRSEFKNDIKSIASNVAEIKTHQIVSYAHEQNMDARLTKVEDKQERWYVEQKRYWRKEYGAGK